MATNHSQIPVHDRLTVLNSEPIYRTDEWWKAVVEYYYGDNPDSDEVAIFLWHLDEEDDSWTQKNKYVIRTLDGWQTDKAVIEQFLQQEFDGAVGSEYPVSDYYEVAAGRTVFQSDGWWKAILNVSKKGSYETDEVIIYLWQNVDGDWRRRQKYAIKDNDDWDREAEIIDSILSGEMAGIDTPPSAKQSTAGCSEAEPETKGPVDGEAMAEIEQLEEEISKHISHEFSEGDS